MAKHGIDFADAPRIFRLPLCISLDESQDYGEDRWIGLGILDGRVVVVVFTEPNEQTIRIISLCKALPYERKCYEQFLKDELGQS
ncbi:BrnT family toxin [Komarekiella delphini-convector]|uniref:BrnT family toxin n=1 Tax=Komarekiella delphini-convector TaxID=3050158 RepID=UPI0032B00C4B